MSGPSSDGRPSDSPEPSVASSRTLRSRQSGSYQVDGEGSSPRRASLGSRHNSGTTYGVTGARSHDRESPLSVEDISEQDFAQRRQRNRKSGGFLLDSTFGTEPRTRQSRYDARGEDAKGKRTSRYGHALDREESQKRSYAGDGASGSSPLARTARTTDQKAADRKPRVDSGNMHQQQDGAIHMPKKRGGTPGMQSTAHDRRTESQPAAHHSTIDPNQIVHMALNLSESRRRNISAGQLLVPKSRVSSMVHADGSSHTDGAGSNLRQYLSEQRRISQNISPKGGARSPARHMSTSVQRRGSLFIQGRSFDPSDATLARRDKARAFFELRMEYLRLLELLPPLKPDSSDPRNFVVTANNVPGSPQAHLTRVPSYAGKMYELGRPYNPLQLLRNRRLRARERRTLDHQPEEFANVDEVRDWVDKVESASRVSQYRQQDGVSLPKYHDDHERPSGPTQPARPHMVWFFSAEELLADAHWLEHGDNKTLLEDRRGSKLFPSREPQKQQTLPPRLSKDIPEKRRKSWVEGLPGVSTDPATGDESETTSERGRKRRLLPTFRAESPKIKKHMKLGSRQQSGNYDDSSDSDSDARQHRLRKPRHFVDEEDNTGPLELRMKELLEKETKEAQLKIKSPAIFTPDTPNKWDREHADVTDPKPSRDSLEVPRFVNGSLRTGLKLPPSSRVNVQPGTDPTKGGRSSFEDYSSTAPSTPHHTTDLTRISSDLSAPPSRSGSMSRRPKKSKFDFFRSDESTKGQKHEHEQKTEPYSASSDKARRTHQTSEDIEEGHGIGSAIWAAPGAVKHLLGHRKNDSVSSLQSPVKESWKEGQDLKEPPSAVTRFFKGVKHEGSKMGDFIFKKDRPAEDSDTDTDTAPDLQTAGTETDEDIRKSGPKRRQHLDRSNTAQTVGSITSKKDDRYHLELPTFRSTYETNGSGDPASATDASDHHITRQTRERKNSRSPRFDKLAPPPMDMSRVTTNSHEPEGQERIKQVLALPGAVRRGLPVTALGKGEASRASGQRSSSRPTLEGKRQWSITDDDGNLVHHKPTSKTVTQADIARVRALFLCSGVKAKEISRKSSEARPVVPPFLVRAAKTANTNLFPVSRKEEHALAARILVRSLESETDTLHHSAEEFRDNTVKELTSMIATLKSTVEADLFPRVRSSGDEAVKITSEVSSSAPLTVKQISDEIDRMLRLKRRRMIWVRRVGWTMVEWMLLGFMWFAWLTVMIVGFFGRIVGFGWSVVRWLLWL